MSDESTNWYLYVLECADETLYTGITTDPERRVHEHNNTGAGARYTRARRPVEMVITWQFDSQSAAASAEHAFKALERDEKVEYIDKTTGFDGGDVVDVDEI